MEIKSALGGAGLAIVIGLGFVFPALSKRNKKIDALERTISRMQPNPAALPTPTHSTNKPNPTTADPSATRRAPSPSPSADPAKPLANHSSVDSWSKDILQITDLEKKEAALDQIYDALNADDPNEILTALQTWEAIGKVEFDRSSFRDPLITLLDHANGEIRAKALGALASTGKHPEDIDRAITLADDEDPTVRQMVVAALFFLSDGELTGRNGEVVLNILDKVDEPSHDWFGSLWGAKFNEDLERHFLKWGDRSLNSGTSGTAYNVFYYNLSTQQNKGPATVDYLISQLSDEDTTNIAGRAAWGLTYGVAPDKGSEKKIADAAITVFSNRSDGYLRKNLLKTLQLYGDATHAEALDALTEAPAMGAKMKAQLKESADSIRSR